MFLQKTLELYASNSKLAVIFGVLLVFVALFVQFKNVFASSGSMFLEYGLGALNPATLSLEIIAIIVFLALYSVFVTLVVFSVRKQMSHVRVEYYLSEMIQKFSLKIFAFYLALVLGLFALGLLLVQLELSVLIVNAVLLIIALFFLFTPQSIAVDEKGIAQSVYYNIEFISKNPGSFLLVIIVSVIALLIVPVIEIYFDQFNFAGSFVGIIILLIFVVPFIEVLKTQVYMMKFELVKQAHKFERQKK